MARQSLAGDVYSFAGSGLPCFEFCYASAMMRIDAHLVCKGNHRPLCVRRPQQRCVVFHEESKVLCTGIETCQSFGHSPQSTQC